MTSKEWVDLLTPVVGPALTAVAKKLAPKVPPSLVPLIAVVLGAASNLIGTKAIAGAEPNVLSAALLGLAGIGVYEATKPITKKTAAVASAFIGGFMLLFAAPANAADAPKTPAPPEAQIEYYRAGELSLDGFGQVSTSNFDDERSAAGVGANFFVTKNLGIGASTYFEDFNGIAFDNLSVRGIFRAPINQYAFYAFAGANRDFDDGEWNIFGGPGFEWRWTKHIGTYTEINFDKQLTGTRDITAQARIGLRYAF